MKNILTTLFASLLLLGCKGSPPKTSADASIGDVTFLNLPLDATKIQYWDDGNSRIAKFVISEDGFRELFARKEFAEITEPIDYEGDVFDKPSKRPRGVPNHGSETAKSGLIYQKIESNGGGETIIYDRDASIAYYDYAKR